VAGGGGALTLHGTTGRHPAAQGEGAADIAGLFGGTNLGVPIVCETQVRRPLRLF
jgi:hypothetical protein